MARRRVRRNDLDVVEKASIDSFPASDPPAWVPVHVGAPCRVAEQLRSDAAAREVWNFALEEIARLVERAEDGHPQDQLPADIRAMKQPPSGEYVRLPRAGDAGILLSCRMDKNRRN